MGLVSEAWRRGHLEEFDDEKERPQERIATVDKRRRPVQLNGTLQSTVGVRLLAPNFHTALG